MFHKPVISQSKPIINQLTVTLNEENIPNTKNIKRINECHSTAMRKKEAIDYSKRKQKRLQAKTRKVLTTPEVLEGLDNELKRTERKRKRNQIAANMIQHQYEEINF